MIYSQKERIRWRESTLWGETPEEQYKDYASVSRIPGRMEHSLMWPEAPHYEPTRLVVNGNEYQPLDRWRDRAHTYSPK